MNRLMVLAAAWLFSVVAAAAPMVPVDSAHRLLLPSASGPMTPATPNKGGLVSGCSASSAFVARTSGLSILEQNSYATMICGMVADAVGCSSWGGGGNLDVLYIWVTNSATTALLNLCGSSFSATATGGMFFQADLGYTGAAGEFIDSTFVPSTAAGNCTLNSCSAGIYDFTSSLSNTFKMGGEETAATNSLEIIYSGVGVGFNVNNSNANVMSFINPDSQGTWIGTRTASNVAALYRNGNTTPVVSGSAPSTGLPVFSQYFFSINYNGAPLFSTTDNMGAGFIGGGLTATQQCKIASRINDYMTAFGLNIYGAPSC
jgi:hypothetical protein